jgi:hypothetical protein
MFVLVEDKVNAKYFIEVVKLAYRLNDSKEITPRIIYSPDTGKRSQPIAGTCMQ